MTISLPSERASGSVSRRRVSADVDAEAEVSREVSREARRCEWKRLRRTEVVARGGAPDWEFEELVDVDCVACRRLSGIVFSYC